MLSYKSQPSSPQKVLDEVKGSSSQVLHTKVGKIFLYILGFITKQERVLPELLTQSGSTLLTKILDAVVLHFH